MEDRPSTIRFYSLEDFLEELKRNGNMETRGEVLYQILNEYEAVFNLVLTSTAGKNIIIHERLLSKVWRADEKDMKEKEEKAKITFEKLKDAVAKEHSVSVLPGVIEG